MSNFENSGPFDGGDAMDVAMQEKDALRAERDALAAKLAIAQGMADTMAMLRSEMIDAGVIDASVAPMFFPESIIPRLRRLAELEGQEPVAWYADYEDWGREYNGCPELSNGVIGKPLYARPVPAEPVNVDFGKRGENMFFNIGNQSFLLDYKPEEQDEFDFMKAMLLSAFSRITHGVKTESQPVNARLLDVAVWPAGYCRDPNGKMSIPAGKEEDFNFGYDVGFQEAWEIMNSAISAEGKSPTSQQERLLQDMHDAGREIDRVMDEAAPKAPQVDFEAIARAIWNVRREGEDRCDMELEDLGTDHSVWEEASEVASILEDAGIEVAE